MNGSRVAGLAITLMAVLVSGACASGGGVPQPFPVPGGSAAPDPVEPVPVPSPSPAEEGTTARPSPTLPPDGYALSGTALSLRGAPYRNGGTTPAGFDCSGFVQYVYARHGLALPRETREQFRVGARIRNDDLQPGDLVFFTTIAPGASHVGIIIGGDQFVHAPTERGVVRVERLSAEYWRRRFVGARRPRGR